VSADFKTRNSIDKRINEGTFSLSFVAKNRYAHIDKGTSKSLLSQWRALTLTCMSSFWSEKPERVPFSKK